MTSIHVEELVNKGALKAIAKDLGLKHQPVIEYDPENKGCTAYINQTVHYQNVGFFNKRVTGMDTDGIIHVNPKAAEDMFNYYSVLCFSKKAGYDALLQVLRHECRHIYQSEHGMFKEIYEEKYSFNMDFIDGYGGRPNEADANQYAVDAASTERSKLLAIVERNRQDNAGKVIQNIDWDSEVKMIAAYNPIIGTIIKAGRKMVQMKKKSR